MSPPSEKACAACGRRIEWRKKWANSWDDVRYCSAACRRRRLRPVDEELSVSILRLLSNRAGGVSICPSEAARAVATDRGMSAEYWRELMEPARMAARRLVHSGDVEIVERGRVVDPSTARGPIRIRRAHPGSTTWLNDTAEQPTVRRRPGPGPTARRRR